MSTRKEQWTNPFSVDRVEDWRVEEHPENYKKIAALFAPPAFMDEMENPEMTKAIFIVGGRGSGKSHILKRMAIQAEIKALENIHDRKLKSGDFQKNYFGIYIKTDCFSPLSSENISYIDEKERGVLFEHLLNIEVCKAIVEGIRFFNEYCDINLKDKEGQICKAIEVYLKKTGWSISINSLSDFLDYLEKEAIAVTRYTKYVLFDESIRKNPGVNFTQGPEFITKIYNIIASNLKPIKGKSFMLLLDEYESLDESQQKIINQIIKNRKLTLRIAVKVRGVKTLSTKTSEVLEEIHDYHHIGLHFKLDPKVRAKYKNLASQIFNNRLGLKTESGTYKVKDPKKLLPAATLKEEGISEEDLTDELKKMKDSLRKDKTITDSEEYFKNFKGHYKEAALFRLLKDRGKDKLYSGFDEYVSLSSGIIRLFIWLCREAFKLAHQKGINIESGKPIDVHIQAEAASNVAKSELNITIPQTIKNIYASKLAYFVYDIGQILRARVFYSTQPQANRIEIIDPESFESEHFKIPRELIESGHDLPVLLTEHSFKPRDTKYPFPKTFSLNNIFVPLFNVPSEGRWRTELTAEEIKKLCMTESRAETLEKIVNQIRGKKRKIRGAKKSIKHEDKTLNLFTKPITLENCPITGAGCNQNLIEDGHEKNRAFLAIPFNEGWISDPRSWLKSGLGEVSIVCKDISDFGALGYFLCKICSCVRQYQIGIFEITELNPNVIFELGMAIGLCKPVFLFVNKDQIPAQYNNTKFPPPPFEGIEYIPYELGQSAINKTIASEVSTIVTGLTVDKRSCCIIKAKCPHVEATIDKKKVFVALPSNKTFFDEVYGVIEKIAKPFNWSLSRHAPLKSLSDLCQTCKGIRDSFACIIDTTSNDLSMLFALGVAFGRDKKFIQLHNVELGGALPISDLIQWAIKYKNIGELEKLLGEELKKRFKE